MTDKGRFTFQRAASLRLWTLAVPKFISFLRSTRRIGLGQSVWGNRTASLGACKKATERPVLTAAIGVQAVGTFRLSRPRILVIAKHWSDCRCGRTFPHTDHGGPLPSARFAEHAYLLSSQRGQFWGSNWDHLLPGQHR